MLYFANTRYDDEPAYDGTIDAGTIAAVESQPNAPGVFSTVRSALKRSRKPREPLNGLPRIPKYTSPSGATVGDAVLSSEIAALLT